MSEKSDSGPPPGEPAPRRSLVWKALRAVRYSLDDNGPIGRVLASRIYWTLRDLRMIWLVVQPLLWVVEHYFGKYFIRDPTARIMMQLFPRSGEYGPLGQALQSEFMSRLWDGLIAWWFVEFALLGLSSALDKYVAEPYEIAQREYDEARRQLGDTSDDDEDQGRSFLAPVVGSRLFRYLYMAMVGWLAIQMVSDVGFGIHDAIQSELDAMPEATPAELARLNPHRDIPPANEPALRELVYFSHVLRDLTPTTLPGDDYQLYSDILRSLETRKDMSWRIFEESNVGSLLMAAANRDGYGAHPIADEPFLLNERIKAVHTHWFELALLPDKPERWEDGSDTTFVKPIARGRGLEGQNGAKLDADAHEADTNTDDTFQLRLTQEQEEEATRIYTKWRKDRDHKVSYLKLYPPRPMAWVPIPNSQIGIKNAWDSVLDGRPVGAGKRVAGGKLAGSRQWKPLFRSLNIERVPWDWQGPDGEESQTEEEISASIDAMMAESAIVEERRARQASYQQELKEKLQAKAEKPEL